MRSRLVTLLVLLLALAVPLQGLLAGAMPIERADAQAAMMLAVDEAPCHGHGQDSGGAAADSGNAGCGCCAVCGSAALPAGVPLLAHNELRSTTATPAPAAAVAFVTEGPERPPRG